MSRRCRICGRKLKKSADIGPKCKARLLGNKKTIKQKKMDILKSQDLFPEEHDE